MKGLLEELDFCKCPLGEPTDHTHRHWLHPRHAAFYTRDGLSRLRKALHPGGVFAMWADGLPDPEFAALLSEVFGNAEGRAVSFPNPHTGGESASTVYLAGGTLTISVHGVIGKA